MSKETLRERLLQKFRDREYRDAYAESHTNAAIALQIKALRLQRGWTQAQLAEASNLKQSQISAIEQTHFEAWTIRTLRRVAAAFGLPLLVKFASWSTLLEDVCHLSQEDLERPMFDDDPVFGQGVAPVVPFGGKWHVKEVPDSSSGTAFSEDRAAYG